MYTVDGLNTVQISKIIGCSDSAIGRLLVRSGISKREHFRTKITDIDKIDDIKNRYISGETTVEIAGIYDVNERTIANILNNNRVMLRKAVRRSIVKNHRYFEVIDTPDKAYFLGWMISDGSVVRSKTRNGRSDVISIEIKSTDEYILHMFASYLDAKEGSVRKSEKRGHSHFRFASNDMSNDLSKYGVVPNKTYSAYLPNIDDDLMSHLIRGYFDGNGTIVLDKNRNYGHVGIYGTEELCSQISKYMHDVIGINDNKVSKTTCWHVWWGGRDNVKKIRDYLYKDCGDLYLTRKKKKFDCVL